MLTPLPFLEGARRLTSLPFLETEVLVIEADIPTREPPPDSATYGGALTPTVRIAITFTPARIVDRSL